MTTLTEFRSVYREYRDQTCELLADIVANVPDSTPGAETFRRLPVVIENAAGREILFARLLKMFRGDQKVSRRELREMMEDGSFWDKFFDFLQNVDWEKVFNLILTFMEAMLKIFALV